MALVGYSDSEDSETETQSQPAAATDKSKKFDRTATKKIKVDLAGLTSQPTEATPEEPASKRQRTGGAFSGFNALLPAPKRAAQPTGKRNISLKTSSEAAFSREPQRQHEAPTDTATQIINHDATPDSDAQQDVPKPAEVKLVGKATRFVPLSVANARKKKPLFPAKPPAPEISPPSQGQTQTAAERSMTQVAPDTSVAKPKPKRSLFSTAPGDESGRTASSDTYQPEFSESVTRESLPNQDSEQTTSLPSTATAGVQNVASNLNLSASERRRIFGRNAARDDIKIASFDMDAEYRANQELAAKGDVFEHRAVKAIAPGKHSLQQLVNNVKSQTDALEDKWAEGRRNRSEAGSKYGW